MYERPPVSLPPEVVNVPAVPSLAGGFGKLTASQLFNS